MSWRLPGIFLGTLLYSSALLAADQVMLNAEEIEKLGIELTQPRAAQRLSALSANARVVVPPDREFVVSAAQEGLIVRLLAASGDQVSKGQVLARVQSPGFLTAQSEFLDAFGQHKMAEAQLKRDRQLLKEGIIASRRMQEAQTAADAATTRLLQSRRLLVLAGMSETDIKALAARRKLQDAMAVRAPIDGVVLEQFAASGQRVDSMDPLYRVADLDELWLEIQVPQEQIQRVQPGMRVAVEDSGVSNHAEVVLLGRQVDPDTQSVTVRAALASPDPNLRPGQLVTVTINSAQPAGSDKPVLLLNGRAVVYADGAAIVFARNDAGFEPRSVTTLGRNGGQVYVTGELDIQDSVAVSGVAALKVIWLNSKDAAP